ncbi:MAG TPA: hypothetical protein VMI10_03405 [Terriglobales bacterium]|nr:hypothetical protein [Terriglobales bacterium]
MESTGVRTARDGMKAKVTPTVSVPGLMQGAAAQALDAGTAHSTGYGMPCAKCRAYYPSDMDACPICKSRERVKPGKVGAAAAHAASTPAAAAQSEEAKRLAEERERLRELKSQIYASQPQVPATTFRCALDQNHDGTVEPAAICHGCYSQVRQEADRVEAALRMDVKEAAKIVYEAVWADTSDPDKTYYNAAVALLGELRKRAGLAK